jgi:TPP-dependent pyruvate/acetoin dehydrogenase alpha subunit
LNASSAGKHVWRPPATEPGPTSGHPRQFLLDIFERMLLIRSFELRVNEMFLKGLIPGTIHLSHGQEATTVGACWPLRTDDVITMTHRAHGQALAKGVSARSLMAELLGKETGCSGGKGGSLHVGDMSVGALTSIAIVGAGCPIATGFAFAFKQLKTDRVAMAFFGDGTANKGDLHEAMNLAATWQLPVVFLCENNFYASTTNLNEVMLNERVAERAAAYRMPGITIYGNDPLQVYETVAAAVERARVGDGPTFVECLTYRHGGHKRDDPAAYRPREEVELWKGHDPVATFRATLLADTRFSEADLATVEQAVGEQVEDAVQFAVDSPYPPPEAAVRHVYA